MQGLGCRRCGRAPDCDPRRDGCTRDAFFGVARKKLDCKAHRAKFRDSFPSVWTKTILEPECHRVGPFDHIAQVRTVAAFCPDKISAAQHRNPAVDETGDTLARAFLDALRHGTGPGRVRNGAREGMPAGACELGCAGEVCRRVPFIDQHRIAECQRAGLVEDHVIDGRNALKRIAGREIDSLAEQAPGGDDLDQRRCERDGARTCDDQHGDGDEGGLRDRRAKDEPADESKRRHRVNLRHVGGDGLVGEAAVGRFLLFARLKQARDVCHQGLAGWRKRAHFDRRGKVDGAGVEDLAQKRARRVHFAGDEAEIDRCLAGQDLRIDRQTLPSRYQQLVARPDVGCANGFGQSFRPQPRGAARLHRRECVGSRVSLPAEARIEKTTDQQEEQQHDGGVKVGVDAARHGCVEAENERQNHSQRDGYVHVQAAMLERSER